LFNTHLKIPRKEEDHVQHIGEHPCNLMIAPGRINEIVALQSGAKGHDRTQMDMYPIEDWGLVTTGMAYVGA